MELQIYLCQESLLEKNTGFSPCTPQACLESLNYYKIPIEGKKVVVIGHSLVVGKPIAMLMLSNNATVTICHIKTVDLVSACKNAEILIVAVGVRNLITTEHFTSDQIIIDVGINIDEDGKLCGDVNFMEADKIVSAITPVPGGVGTVTTSVLVKHVVEAANRTINT